MTERIRPRRSALYMPASNERALEKAKTLGVDAVIFDLEDSVGPDAKAEARLKACAAVSAGGYGSREVIVRVNGLGTPWGAEDFASLAASGADAVCVPKVQSAQDVVAIRNALDAGGAPPGLSIWAMIETPLGILNAKEIGMAAGSDKHPISVLLMGTNDIAKETRAAQTRDRLPMLASLSHCILVARAHGLDILDGVYNNFRDSEGLESECLHGRALGMDGKTLIHPGQIEICNKVFSPPDDEVEEARKIIAAFERQENKGKGVINLDGQMVELLHREMALRTVAIADAIAEG
ncbi:MAG: HpcH/HpaI aldolase/citrate lyase family protein [Alphaproteobacteria bacterium]